MRTTILIYASAGLLQASAAFAQNLGPGNPDVVLECYQDNKPAASCQYSCGTEMAMPPGGKQVSWGNVDRVEIYHKGNVGRSDSRSFVFVRYKPSPQAASATIGMYIGPRYFCSGAVSAMGGTGINFELRITKFNFD